DVHGALDALPSLPLDGGPNAVRERVTSTGTDTYGRCAVALPVALTPDNPGQTVADPDKTRAEPPNSIGPARLIASAQSVASRDALTIPDRRPLEWAMQDLNLRPPACRAGALAN